MKYRDPMGVELKAGQKVVYISKQGTLRHGTIQLVSVNGVYIVIDLEQQTVIRDPMEVYVLDKR